MLVIIHSTRGGKTSSEDMVRAWINCSNSLLANVYLHTNTAMFYMTPAYLAWIILLWQSKVSYKFLAFQVLIQM